MIDFATKPLLCTLRVSINTGANEIVRRDNRPPLSTSTEFVWSDFKAMELSGSIVAMTLLGSILRSQAIWWTLANRMIFIMILAASPNARCDGKRRLSACLCHKRCKCNSVNSTHTHTKMGREREKKETITLLFSLKHHKSKNTRPLFTSE